jgi:aspartate/methionine/tyrosine aminotransferase
MEISTSARLNGVGEYYFSQKLQQIEKLNSQGASVINLGIGSPDLPPHPDVIKALRDESEKLTVHGYQSYRGVKPLREAIADWYKRWYQVSLSADTEILPLMGSKEGIMHICMTYLNKGDAVLVPDPGYPTYKSAVLLAQGKTISYKLVEKNNYEPDFASLEKRDLSKVKLMFVNYPQMPTGQLPTIELFKKIVAFAKRHNILVIHDNPYSFILNDNPLSILSVDGAKDCALELNSLSKSHNMAGWRVGMLVGDANRINEVLRFRSNMDSGMFLPLQLAAAKALSLGKDWHDSVNKIYNDRRLLVYKLLRVLKCRFSTSQAGLFVWAKVGVTPSEASSHSMGKGGWLSDKVLNESSVFITPGAVFGDAGKNYVRISLCSSEETITKAIDRVGSNNLMN